MTIPTSAASSSTASRSKAIGCAKRATAARASPQLEREGTRSRRPRLHHARHVRRRGRRADPRRTPNQTILFVSGYSETEAVKRTAPDAPLLAKPFRAEALDKAVPSGAPPPAERARVRAFIREGARVGRLFLSYLFSSRLPDSRRRQPAHRASSADLLRPRLGADELGAQISSTATTTSCFRAGEAQVAAKDFRKIADANRDGRVTPQISRRARIHPGPLLRGSASPAITRSW